MPSIADLLLPDIARQLHPDRRKNEGEYWLVRDQLLTQFRGQWIGFADRKVIASGDSRVAVFHAAESSGRHPFFICVGYDEEPCGIRRARVQPHSIPETSPFATREFSALCTLTVRLAASRLWRRDLAQL